jgi:hypothetical protein
MSRDPSSSHCAGMVLLEYVARKNGMRRFAAGHPFHLRGDSIRGSARATLAWRFQVDEMEVMLVLFRCKVRYRIPVLQRIWLILPKTLGPIPISWKL